MSPYYMTHGLCVRMRGSATALGPERTREELIPFLNGASRWLWSPTWCFPCRRTAAHPQLTETSPVYICFRGARCDAALPPAESVDDDDEILLVLAEELGKMVDAVGGPSWSHVLLVPLENLAMVEEMTVREAVRALNET